MGSVGFSEIAFIAVLALFVLGPDRLPAAARSLGKAVAEFRRLTSGARSDLEQAIDASGMRDTLSEIRGTVDELNPRRIVTDSLRTVDAVGQPISAANQPGQPDNPRLVPPPDSDVAEADDEPAHEPGQSARRAPSHQIGNSSVAAPLGGRFHDVLLDQDPQ